jgi:hypothetical protein
VSLAIGSLTRNPGWKFFLPRVFSEDILDSLAKIKGRVIAESLLDEEGHLIYDELNPVLYVGDGAKRAYRYTEKVTMDYPKSFL